MPERPRLLDLYCRAGGSAMGYHLAGFAVTGVDQAAQPRFPFAFVQAEALAYVQAQGHTYDVVTASPPCQRYSALKGLTTRAYPDLLAQTRAVLQATGRPWVLENVPGAPLRWPLLLCGTMFGLHTACGARLRRHRLFESNLLLWSPGPCAHHASGPERTRTITITGATPQRNVERNRLRETFPVAAARQAMGIPWMGMRDLSQAVPPAYTAWIGAQLLRVLQAQEDTL